MKRPLYHVPVIVAALMCCGCQDDDKAVVHVEKVTIDVRSLHLNPGKEYRLSVTIEPENATNRKIAWYSSDRSVAVVDADGLVRALAMGEVKITAEANDLHVNDEIMLTVDDVDNSIPIESIALDAASRKFDFGAAPDDETWVPKPEIRPAEATNKRLLWSSDDPLVASVSPEGVVTALSHGKTVVRVKTTDGSDKEASCAIAVVGVKDRNYASGDDYYRIVYYPVNITVEDPQGVASQQTWLDRNLGARNVASASDDHTSFGSLFQWSRKADGHEKTVWTSATAGAFVHPLAPVNARTADRRDAGTPAFIPTNAEPHDWALDETSDRDGLWGGRFEDRAYAAPADDPAQDNNPCPAGYRVPAVDEFIAMARAVTGLEEMEYGNNTYRVPDLTTLFAGCALKLPFAGQAVVGGKISGNRAVYWTNMPIIANAGNVFSNAARFIMLNGDHIYLNNYQRTNAYSVRCIRQEPLDQESAEMR